tara:strand:+ start:913 stop:2349 length:1437 start_codon:yes stop_codon:yes gene_type:complete
MIKNICCIGAGYVGGPTMAVIADNCPNIQVNVVDKNIKRIDQWNTKNLSNLPIYEPGLEKIIERCRNINLHFSAEIEKNIKKADMIFISVNTPTKKYGIGAGKASDLKYVEACARQVALFSEGHTIVIEKSTLPVRTAEVIKTILKSAQNSKTNKKTLSFDILSNPEFLAEGSAISDLLNPDRVLIGGESDEAMNSLKKVYENWVPKDKILLTNIWSSELAKLTANAFLAQRISSINAIGALCEATGADVREVARAIGTDSRIGSKFLDSGPGFGGSCFKKDILNLVYLSEYFGLKEVAHFWEEVVNLNTWHQHRISKLIIKNLFGTVSGKKICILGFAFKANTNDTRESSAIIICKDLIEEGAILFINDPKVEAQQISEDLQIEENIKLKELEYEELINKEGNWCFEKDIYQGFENADAVVVLTEWNDYSTINWGMASNKLRKPGCVFDARSILNKEDVIKNDLKLWRIGDGYKLEK